MFHVKLFGPVEAKNLTRPWTGLPPLFRKTARFFGPIEIGRQLGRVRYGANVITRNDLAFRAHSRRAATAVSSSLSPLDPRKPAMQTAGHGGPIQHSRATWASRGLGDVGLGFIMVTKPRTVKKTAAISKKRNGAATKRKAALPSRPPGPDAIVDIPPRNTFNKNLTSASEASMLKLFGIPGEKTKNCNPVTGDFKKRIVTKVDVGPFKVSGLDIAVSSLTKVFEEAETQIPNVVAAVKSDGMLCVRHKRESHKSFSNHSWGTAIDLFFGDACVPQGRNKTHLGCLQLAPFFNKHGWYWGAGFSGKSVDSMHFELAEEMFERAEETIAAAKEEL
jgi:D-alanyl-D-alanine carboxypeptidase